MKFFHPPRCLEKDSKFAIVGRCLTRRCHHPYRTQTNDKIQEQEDRKERVRINLHSIELCLASVNRRKVSFEKSLHLEGINQREIIEEIHGRNLRRENSRERFPSFHDYILHDYILKRSFAASLQFVWFVMNRIIIHLLLELLEGCRSDSSSSHLHLLISSTQTTNTLKRIIPSRYVWANSENSEHCQDCMHGHLPHLQRLKESRWYFYPYQMRMRTRLLRFLFFFTFSTPSTMWNVKEDLAYRLSVSKKLPQVYRLRRHSMTHLRRWQKGNVIESASLK